MTILNKYIKEGCNNSICIVSNLSSHFNAYFWSARLSQLLCLMLQTVKLWEAAFLQNASHCIPYMFSFSSPSEVYSFQSLPASSGGESRNGWQGLFWAFLIPFLQYPVDIVKQIQHNINDYSLCCRERGNILHPLNEEICRAKQNNTAEQGRTTTAEQGRTTKPIEFCTTIW